MSKRWTRTIATATTTVALIGGTAAVSAAYEVRSGDTLSEIAEDHGTSWQGIYAANRDVIADPDLIYVGQVITLDGAPDPAPVAPQAEPEPAASVVLPVEDYTITATFGQSGAYWSSTHTGLDFAAAHGTPVVAVADGTITSAGWAGAYGNQVVIDHGSFTSEYAHLSAITASGHVSAGEQIGRVGSTGNSTGPHLHLEIHDPQPVDPAAFLASRGVTP